MALSSAQNAILKAAILADPTLNAFPANSDGAYGIAAALNLPSSPVTNVWRTEAPTRDIFDAITWANFTPNDAADVTAIFTNRLLLVQTKQMNLQNMLVGRETIDASKANIRSGLRDAVIALPTGTAGAPVSAGGSGGATVLNACLRVGRRAEILLSSGTATTGTVTANVMVFEGNISYQDVEMARSS